MELVRRKTPTLFRAASEIMLLAVLVVLSLLLLNRFATAASQDDRVDRLVANYRAHEDEFRTIASLASVDATFGIDVASGRLGGNGITSEDVPLYGEVLRALDAVGAEHVSASSHALDVVTASEGLAVSGRESGYFYSTASDVDTVTLEEARSRNAPRTWLYPLGSGWYASDYRF